MDNFAYFVCVNPDQNCNKFYQMKQISPDMFEASNGRAGGHTATRTYPMSRWNTKYNEKLKVRNGYVYADVTHLHGEAIDSTDSNRIKSSHPDVRWFLNLLLNESNNSVRTNYRFSSSAVTQQQVDEVQALLDDFANNLSLDNVTYLNKLLVKVFTFLPRTMYKVKDFMIPENPTKDDLIKTLEREEDTLNSMRSMVVATKGNDNITDSSIEDSLNMEIQRLNEDGPYFNQRYTFDVKLPYYQERFDEFVSKQSNKRTMNLFHGSAATNWLSIIGKGLLIRPSGVYHSGSLYGNGIYHSDSIEKSKNYARSNTKIIGVYDVHVGDQYIANYTNARLNWDYIQPKHSVKGGDIEYITFRPEQCVLKRLLVFS